MSDKVKKEIFNSVSESVRALAELFPSAVKDGEVDFDALKQELGEYVEVGTEKYDFMWNGKSNAKAEAVADILGRTLKLKQGEGVNEDTTENLYIEGDNLEALKLLRNSYYNKVKMIYIDPPYNTGSDFVYRDNFNMTADEKRTMDESQGEIDEDGNRLVKNSSDSSAYHTNWLNMMYPRLKVAKDLLTDDGVIFISIDDHEQANLKKICDEVFGADRFVTIIHCQLSTTQGMKVKAAQDGNIVKNGEYILCYSKGGRKNIAIQPLYDLRPEYDEHYSLYLKENGQIAQLRELYDFRFPKDMSNKKPLSLAEAYKRSGEFADIVRSHLADIVCSDKMTGVDISDNLKNGEWTKFERNRKEYLLTLDQNGNIRQLLRLKDSWGKTDGFKGEEGLRKIRGDWWEGFYIDMGNVAKEGGVDYKNGKKPVRLIKQLAKLITTGSDIILDFFSGSATTAHAVIELNAEDGEKRKNIMVQMPEKVDEKHETYQFLKLLCKPAAITEIGKERIRRAGAKIAEANQMTAPNLDIGFKVFKVADTNIKMFSDEIEDKVMTIEQYLGDDLERIDFNAGYTDIDVCYELLLRHRGIPLSSKIDKLGIGERTYLIADSILVCLDQKISESMIEELSKIDPLPRKYIFRDSSFGQDISLKRNAMIHLTALIEKNSGENKKTYRVEFI